jgi:hypothetical protein
MNHQRVSTYRFGFAALSLVLGFFYFVTAQAAPDSPSRAEKATVNLGASHVLPPIPWALEEAARLTASFNVGPRTVDTYPHHLPFQILYQPPSETDTNNTGGVNTTFNVRPGTFLYVPVLHNENTDPVIGNFPPAGDRRALWHYLFSQDELGLVYARIAVDGHVTNLGPFYAVEIGFHDPLPGGGTLYQVVAGFLAPLSKGTHTVEISALATGDALDVPPFPDFFPGGIFSFELTYTIVVH